MDRNLQGLGFGSLLTQGVMHFCFFAVLNILMQINKSINVSASELDSHLGVKG